MVLCLLTEEEKAEMVATDQKEAKWPSVALIATGAMFVLTSLWVMFYSSDLNLSGPAEVAAMARAFIKVVALVSIAASIVQIYGGIQMLNLKGYGWAKAAAIIAICSPLIAGIPGLLLGLPAGIWALVVLRKEYIKAVFEDAA